MAPTAAKPTMPDWALDIVNRIFDAPNMGEGRAVAVCRVAAVIADHCAPLAEFSAMAQALREIAKRDDCGLHDRQGIVPKVVIEQRWPSYTGNGAPAPLLEAMAGATIVRIGTPTGMDLEGGGLAIEFIPRGHTSSRTAVFEFNELGLWLGLLNEPDEPSASPELTPGA